jgi:hypothetical protein
MRRTLLAATLTLLPLAAPADTAASGVPPVQDWSNNIETVVTPAVR